jgi:hypothetical protein
VTEVSVFQIECDGYPLDIASTYKDAMRRLLHRAIRNKTHGSTVEGNYMAIASIGHSANCDNSMAAIRYAISIIPEELAIAEHKLRSSTEERSLHRTLDVMTEFDPTFEIMLHLHCVQIGQFSMRKARRELAKSIETGVRRTVWSARYPAGGIEHVRDVYGRNGGINFMSDVLSPDNLNGLSRSHRC